MELRALAESLVNDVIALSRLDVRVKARATRGRGVVVAIGKGAVQMARGLLETFEAEGGIVVTARGAGERVGGLELIESSHPLPDESSLRAGEGVLEWVRSARTSRLVVLVSGGASALVEKPLDPLTIEDVRETTKHLLSSGATIHEINAVRKHLSATKGGRLASFAYPAPVTGLYASDVPGDNMDAIGSGPTVGDPTTFRDAEAVIQRYGLEPLLPHRVIDFIREGAAGKREETPKPGSPQLSKTNNELVATNMDVLRGLEEKLKDAGFSSMILTSRVEGEAKEVGRALASITLEAMSRGVPVSPPGALLMGGETTVRVRGKGRGGRNMELALSWALTMRRWGGKGNAVILSMDTDGIDGYTDAAGVIASAESIERALDMKLDPHKALEENDSYSFFERVGGLIRIGPTGSNLNSLQVVLFERY
ncbi:MAG: glycerate kinase [Acidilobaceae archaeon]|nr:glycerate kinase [Acidilobaceae archaeon]